MSPIRPGIPSLLAVGLVVWSCSASAADSLAEQLGRIDPVVAPAPKGESLVGMQGAFISTQRKMRNDEHDAAWEGVRTRADWDAFRKARLDALRRSLGPVPDPPKSFPVRVTGTIAGEGFTIENLVFESRPGLWVTANLYRPATAVAGGNMPGILICHAHHTPKEHGELQDMGMTWARAGCLVLVMDQLGHGERRQHPFFDASSFTRPYRMSRQDYHFRYDNGIQCHLAGESLIGWMVWDLRRGVDLLLSRQGIDPQRIILLGAVAGGGDPSAVAAALDERIAAVAPFNFGGPHPEPHYPFPPDQEPVWDYAGGGSWESTRNLLRSAADGFPPWLIVAAAAPRRLIYAHEFAWFRAGDPVWKRLQKIYGFYDVPERLAFTFGKGDVAKQPPEATHCTHIGPVQRVLIHDALRRWFAIDVNPDAEYQNRLPAERLRCLSPEVETQIRPRKLADLLGELADERLAAARRHREGQSPEEQRRGLRAGWARLLGNSEPAPRPVARTARSDRLGGITLERVLLTTEPGVVVPLLLLTPEATAAGTKPPVVLGFSAGGKAQFLRDQAASVAAVLEGRAAVCLVDVRGTGETAPGPGRGRTSTATVRSSSLLMLGETQVGAQLRDARSALAWLHSRNDLDGTRVALWGDSPAAPNPPGTNFHVPRDGDDDLPAQAEPLGDLLALLVALHEDAPTVRAVYSRGGLATFRSVLQGHLVLIPHDVVVPGVLTVGDLSDIAAAIAPWPLRQDGLVDGLNRRVLALAADNSAPAEWLLRHLSP